MSKVIAETVIAKDAKPFEKRIYGQHVVKIFDQSEDASQMYPYFVVCSCGHEGRFYKLEDAEKHVYQHSGQTARRVNTNGTQRLS